AGRACIEGKHLLVKGALSGLFGINVRLHGCREIRCRYINWTAAARQHVPQTLVVVKEVQLVLEDRAAEGPAPLVAVRERLRSAGGVIEPIVCVQIPTGPIPLGISVERVGA